MTDRTVQLVILCEDTQQETFIRRFLKQRGWDTRRLRVEKAPSGRGSGEQFVRKRFPVELDAYRKKATRVKQAVVVMLDGDKCGPGQRLKELDDACTEKGIQPRRYTDRVVILVPTWNIETWFAYLDGQTVDETKSDYPRLKRERDCQRHVEALSTMCRYGQLRQPVPSSLQNACKEYSERLSRK